MIEHFPLDRLRVALEADGVTVVVVPGAQGRSARRFTGGYYRGCQASVVHHTASSGRNPAAEIEFILRGRGDGFVISNAYTALDGTVHLIASGPTYTEGAGGPYGIIPKDRANDVAFSNEVAGGLGAPFPTPAQTRSVALFHGHANRIAADVWGWPDDPFSPHRLFAHFDWRPGGKIDPSGESPWAVGYTKWDMDAFRADARAATETAPPPQEDDDMMTGLIQHQGDDAIYAQFSNGTKTWVPDLETLQVFNALGHTAVAVMPDAAWMKATGPIVGPIPTGRDGWGLRGS